MGLNLTKNKNSPVFHIDKCEKIVNNLGTYQKNTYLCSVKDKQYFLLSLSTYTNT